MKAIFLARPGGVEQLEMTEQPQPRPAPGEVLVKVESAGVNFADVLIRRGLYRPLPAFPLIPGTDTAGTIEAVGEGVSHLTVGQRVVALSARGGYAQYAAVPAAGAVPLPDEIDFDLAAGLPVSGMTAYHLTHTVCDLAPGKTLVVYAAAGSVGSLTIGLAKTKGATVIALVGSPAKAERALELGADHVINYTEETDVPARVIELTGGRGVDAIHNSVLGPTIADDFRMIAPFGQIVWFGIAAGLPNSKQLLASMMRRFVDSPTLTFYHLLASVRHDPKRHRQGWQTLFGYLLDGKARLPIHAVYPLFRAKQAHEELENRQTLGKCILKPWRDEGKS